MPLEADAKKTIIIFELVNILMLLEKTSKTANRLLKTFSILYMSHDFLKA